MPRREPPYFLKQLAAMCRRHPLKRKLVFVPRLQLGMTVTRSLAESGTPWVNLKACTPLDDARRRLYGTRADVAPVLDPVSEILIADRILQRGDLVSESDLEHFASPLAATFRALRGAGVNASAWVSGGDAAESTRRLEHVGRHYAAFERQLEGGGVDDEARVYRLALQLLEANEVEGRDTVVAVFDEVELTPLASAYVRALAGRAVACYRIGHSEELRPDGRGLRVPSHSAAGALFSSEMRPDAGSAVQADYHTDELTVGHGGYLYNEEACPASAEGFFDFVQCIGTESEVRSTLQRVLEQEEVRLEDVEIAYTSEEQYLGLLVSALRMLDLPATFATGVPLRMTRSGASLLGFLEWVDKDLSPYVLMRLLRGGRLRLTGVLDDEDGAGQLLPHRAATLLGTLGLAERQPAYRERLAQVIRDRRLEPGAYGAIREEDLTAYRQLEKVLGRLLKLVPTRRMTAAEAAHQCITFLDLFSPVAAQRRAAGAYSQDELAQILLKNQLHDIADHVARQTASEELVPCERMLRYFCDQVQASYVEAQAPRPGALHVVPLESAGYAHRSQLFVLGLDAASVASSSSDDPLLLDEERAAIDDGLALAEEEAERRTWQYVRALGRHTGTVTCTTNRLQLAEEPPRELAPSALYLRLMRLAGHDPDVELEHVPRQGLVPEQATQALDECDAFLASYQQASADATDLIGARYPWCRLGRTAARDRAEGVFGRYDGLLDVDQDSSLDPLEARRLSSSRLERLAACPYSYFLRYVLGVRELDEAEPGQQRLDRAKKGTILHDAFWTFMTTCDGPLDQASWDEHWERLCQCIDDRIDEHKGLADQERLAAQWWCRQGARIFLNAEMERAAVYEPAFFEYGFGFNPDLVELQNEGYDRPGKTLLRLADDVTLSFSGWIDRVDRRLDDGSLEVWDYKTGSPGKFDRKDPFMGGRNVQWALYSYVLEDLEGVEVRRAGYFFTSGRGTGQRIGYPVPPREEAARHLRRLARMARHGCFPINPSDGVWRYGYSRLCPDTARREAEINGKLQGVTDDHPHAEHLTAWADFKGF